MRADDLRELMDNFEASGLAEPVKEQIRRVVRQFANRHGMSCFDRDDQIAFIQHLRGNLQESRSVISKRLMASYGISKSTAYERIGEALQLSGKVPDFRTNEAPNAGVKEGDMQQRLPA
jgi:hypothetical protein